MPPAITARACNTHVRSMTEHMTWLQLCKLQNLPPAQHGLRRTPQTSPGLVTMYAVTDVPCIISGTSTQTQSVCA